MWRRASLGITTCLLACSPAGVAPPPATGPTDAPEGGGFEDRAAVVRGWRAAPALDHGGFAEHEDLVVTRPVDGRMQVALVRIFADAMELLEPFPPKEYRAIPLERWLARRGASGSGDHLVVTNLRGETLYLSRNAAAGAVIVVGLDGERNLHRLALPYRLAREYSWRVTPPPPAMIRTVGPFLWFPGAAEDVPADVATDTTLAGFALGADAFRWVAEDPVGAVRAEGPILREALLGADGCLKCHAPPRRVARLQSEDGTTRLPRAHHVRASDGRAHGGFALPLDDYPPAVLHRFLFEQDVVARGFGVTPLALDPASARAIEAFVRPR